MLAIRQELLACRQQGSEAAQRRRQATQRQRRTAPHHQRRRTTNDRRTTMRKLIITAVAVMALTMAVAGTASAAVNVDDSGNGFVGKGDVQTALGGINDAAMQAMWDTPNHSGVEFMSTFKTVKDTSWNCTDGSDQASPVHDHHAASVQRDGQHKQGWQADQRLEHRRLSPTDTGTTTGVTSGRRRNRPLPELRVPGSSHGLLDPQRRADAHAGGPLRSTASSCRTRRSRSRRSRSTAAPRKWAGRLRPARLSVSSIT